MKGLASLIGWKTYFVSPSDPSSNMAPPMVSPRNNRHHELVISAWESERNRLSWLLTCQLVCPLVAFQRYS